MNRLKCWLKNTPKASRHLRWAVVAVIIPLSVLGVSIKSSVGQLGTIPAIATFVDWQGYIRMRHGNGQAIRIDNNSFLKKDIDVLEVAGSSSRNEHWAHLQFKRGNLTIFPLVQAGTDSKPTTYRFPCYFRQGSMVIGWGLRKSRNNACQRIIIASSQWQSSITDTSVAQKSILGKSSEDNLMAQTEPGQLSIKPSNGSTLLYVNQEFGSTVVNVLVGNVTVSSASGRSTLVRQGIRYTDAGNGSRGDTSEVPPEVYNSRPVEIFLDRNTWSADVRFQIDEFQVAVDRILNRPIVESTPTPTIILPTPPTTEDPTPPTTEDPTPPTTEDPTPPDPTPKTPSDSIREIPPEQTFPIPRTRPDELRRRLPPEREIPR